MRSIRPKHWPNISAELRAFLVIAIGCVALQLLASRVASWMVYDRYAVDAGHWWRLVSGNFVHTNFAHLWLNLIALMLILIILPGRNSTLRFLGLAAGCGLAVTLGLHFFSPAMVQYAGLSGVLHGVFVIKAQQEWEANRWLAAAMIAGLGGKLIYEQTAGATERMAQLIQAPVATDAHLFGALGGLVLALGLMITVRKRST